ncbi:glutamic acid-rich protein-like [Belonocnema kinseyi]|uniref:glutamic acid-rich protein-like n=1 Tax=Belonocnema kinseyi TaxID=2817044 RepID=UPI00143CDC01|nr:glutamic acid-rich protein-like [Belonocnema kinseyi]
MNNEKLQPVKELHRPARRNYQRRHFDIRRIDKTWQADLVEMQPSKSKKGEDVGAAMESILDKGRIAKNLHVDKEHDVVEETSDEEITVLYIKEKEKDDENESGEERDVEEEGAKEKEKDDEDESGEEKDVQEESVKEKVVQEEGAKENEKDDEDESGEEKDFKEESVKEKDAEESD